MRTSTRVARCVSKLRDGLREAARQRTVHGELEIAPNPLVAIRKRARCCNPFAAKTSGVLGPAVLVRQVGPITVSSTSCGHLAHLARRDAA